MATHKLQPELPDDDDAELETLHLICMPDGHHHMLTINGASRTVHCEFGCGRDQAAN